MKLNKLDLSNILAISHDDDYLGLVIDRGDSIEVIEIPAPLAAYEGLMQLNTIASDDSPQLSASVDFYELPGVEPEVPMYLVESTMANAVGYDPEHQLLKIEFKNGSIYQYEEVDEETWEEMISSNSTGQFFNREVKGNYPCRRLDIEDDAE